MKSSSSSSWKCRILSLFLLLLTIILLSHLHVSHGADDSPAYDIDYRGPETHPSLSPPSHFRGSPLTRRTEAKDPHKSKNPRCAGRKE
ncbi:hypothetical protein MLD38_016178 [Melastoma candidum]|uniref:Uncharacterized protein n=1 Tax=Melastoma candidum TaxID=119954 RepID=A0ACB9RLP7_9MYRT|nr:hypothetical protein MLD38_016178 [Melastoma candidum]